MDSEELMIGFLPHAHVWPGINFMLKCYIHVMSCVPRVLIQCLFSKHYQEKEKGVQSVAQVLWPGSLV